LQPAGAIPSSPDSRLARVCKTLGQARVKLRKRGSFQEDFGTLQGSYLGRISKFGPFFGKCDQGFYVSKAMAVCPAPAWVRIGPPEVIFPPHGGF